MDIAQLAQMINWLDEEHRRDRAEIARLQQQLETQSAEIVEQTRRIQDLEGRLASTHAQLSRFTQLEQSIQSVKQEIALMLEKEEETRAQGIRELERARLSDREALNREISEVRRELPRLNRLEEALKVRQGEDERLGELIMGMRNQIALLSKELEDRTRQIPFLAEQRTSDTKRIAQLQQETVELFKRTEAQVGRLAVLEESVRKTAVELEKIRPIPGQLREEQQAFMERMRVETVDRMGVLNRWQEIIDEHKSVIAKMQEKLQNFTKEIEEGRRTVQAVREFQETMRRDHAQIEELQRLAEERLHREMDEFREEYEKKRRKEDLRQEHLWKEQEKYNKELADRFSPILHDLKIHEELLRQLWKLQEVYGNRQLGAAQAWLDSLQEALKERDQEVKTLEDEWQKQRRNAELYASQANTRRTAGIVTGEPPSHN
jgi:hypothetical protein